MQLWFDALCDDELCELCYLCVVYVFNLMCMHGLQNESEEYGFVPCAVSS